jgi:16S rRNA (uracil1498-N3)-methyltransferase
MRRFFIPAGNIEGKLAFIDGSDVHHIASVLRKKPGDTILATDGAGNLLECRITDVSEHVVKLEVIESKPAAERATRVKLYQAIPRAGKFETVIEKCTELGVAELVPLVTERTVSRITEERGLKKIARWEKIALETMKQVGRSVPMSIRPAAKIEDIAASLEEGSLRLLFWELEEERTLKAALAANPGIKTVECVIGPEGGLSHSEVETLQSLGFLSVSLGSRVLKVETAVVAAMANVFYDLEG